MIHRAPALTLGARASKRLKLFQASNSESRLLRLTSSSSALRSERDQPVEAREDVVLSKTFGRNGLVTLNRPADLNALNAEMYGALYRILKEWQSSRRLVIVAGAGDRAFCSGGDVKLTRRYFSPGGEETMRSFFSNAYRVFHLVRSYEIPYVALMDNLTMGAGAGLSILGRYRVATERSVFAMPEAAIGFHVDAGCTYVFPRLPGCLGLFLALTGYRLRGPDVFKTGLATHYVRSEQLQDLKRELLENNAEPVDAIVGKYHDIPDEEFELEQHVGKIDACFSAATVEEIISRLESEDSCWANAILRALDASSPTSLKIIRATMERGRNLGFTECLKMEYRITCTLFGRDSDFHEGVRAAIVDKDGKPNWIPRNLRDVTTESIARRFRVQSPERELKF